MRTQKRIQLLIIGSIFLIFFINVHLTPLNDSTIEEIPVDEREVLNIKKPKTSGYWTNFTFIHIDGNWSTAATYDWCSGDGSSGTPYTIENIVMDASTSPTGSGILINNSKNDYFTIKNCTITAADTGLNGGIKLENTDNGTLTGNNCSFNDAHGVVLFTNCTKNTITENTLNDNDLFAIQIKDNCDNNIISDNNATANIIFQDRGVSLLNGCDSNTIIGNNVSKLGQEGIYLENCDYNTISGNIAHDNLDHGIFLYDDSDNNKILGNSLNNVVTSWQNYGIYLYDHCDDNNITGNFAYDNTDTGIFIRDYGDNNLIYENLVGNNITTDQDVGINLNTGCYYNTLSENIVENIETNGIMLNINCSENIIIGNIVRNTTIYGMFINSNSSRNLISGNSIYNNSNSAILLQGDSQYNRISGNSMNNNTIDGIILNTGSSENSFAGNVIANNSLAGVQIVTTDCENNTFYSNSFIGNAVHAIDDSDPGDNQWYNDTIGNYWDNYTGIDLHPEDRIGDTPYTFITGAAGSVDNFPIWDDGDQTAPNITILSPNMFDLFGEATLSFKIRIFEYYGVVDKWYTINDIEFNFTFTENTTIINLVINQNLWSLIPEGLVTITIYATDTSGYTGVEILFVVKSIPEQPADDTSEYEDLINALQEGFNLVLIISVILGIIIAAMGIALLLIMIRNSRKIEQLNQIIKVEQSKVSSEMKRK